MKLPSRLTGKNYRPPPSVNELAYIKKGYKGKNVSGGRRCWFRQSKDFQQRYLATAWFDKHSFSFFIPAPNPVQVRKVQG